MSRPQLAYVLQDSTAAHDRPNRLLLLLLLAAAMTSPWTGVRIAGLNLADFFLVASLALALLLGLTRRVAVPMPWQFVVLPVVVLVLMGRDAVFFDRLPFQTLEAAQFTTGDALGETVGGSATFLVRLVLCWTAVGLSVGAFHRFPRALVSIIAAWLLGIAIGVSWSILQFTFALPDLPFVFHIDSAARAVGLTNHPNSLAETIGVGLPLAVFLALGPRAGLVRRAGGCALVVLSMWGLFLTGSRAGLAVGFFALVLSVIIRLIWSGRGAWGLPLGLLSIVGAVLWLPSVWATTRFSQGVAEASDSARVQALTEGLGIFLRHPLGGAGLSTWLGEMVPLILLSGGGVILFAAFYSSLGSVFRRVWRARGQELNAHLAGAGLVVLAFGLLNNGLVERYLYWPLIVGFYLASARLRSSDPLETVESEPARTPNHSE
ncbi:O-antigen ligase family protein [Curtobacterium sp. VKM Ac-2865]|uniref:O-antigen ligase family protein n=1 Tax=Curtobacterium sp. VKM Ac-2865 TaxID=2783817 RepID=UPI001889F605|nr:O-antigen ligase family protein [Curtobacterium sp. VKM Ac-2865]MBF4582938.1 O-antigen ligase family protein [Curtobacterium sp. VKM Ac-2865]